MRPDTIAVMIEGAVLVISVGGILMRMAYRDGEHSKVHKYLEKRMVGVEGKAEANEANHLATNGVLVELKTDMKWIKEILEEIKKTLGKKDE